MNWIGSSNGGFYFDTSRVGSDKVVLSFGVGMDISFDLGLMEQTACRVIAFDPTPKSIEWIREQNVPENYEFRPFGIAKETGNVCFYLPKNQNHVSGSIEKMEFVNEMDSIEVPMKSVVDIASELPVEEVVGIKMDIEGTEYQVLDALVKVLPNLNQIAVEIHERFVDNGKEHTKKMIQTLNEHKFQLVAISASLEELTFIKSL